MNAILRMSYYVAACAAAVFAVLSLLIASETIRADVPGGGDTVNNCANPCGSGDYPQCGNMTSCQPPNRPDCAGQTCKIIFAAQSCECNAFTTAP